MKRIWTKLGVIVMLLAIAAALIVIGFTREYAVPASGLLELTAFPSADEVVVTGILLSSDARIARVTTTRYADVVLVRVYTQRITDDDDPKTVRGNFAVAIPRRSGMTAIAVGERAHTVTVGRLFGIPIRMPWIPENEGASLIVWPYNERELTRSHH
jgi:hypothetical protein